MKFAFYCNYNKEFNERIETLEEGNIGIGGTQYLFMLVVSNLQKKYGSSTNKYILLTNQKLNVSYNVLEYEQVKDIKEAYKWCEENEYDYLIIRANDIISFQREEIKKSKVKFILWAHNYIGKRTEKITFLEKNIVKLICVSKQQYINMKTSIAYKKMTYINSCIGSYVDNKKEDKPIKNTNKIYYIGAIEPEKGVHNVIEIFSKIYKKKNNVKLILIGGLGSLRAKNITLGKLQLSYPKYEEKLLELIEKNNIKDKVEFLGVLDNREIKEIISKNPGIGLLSVSRPLMGETFCMTALELESYGMPVVARDRKDGLRTSIKNQKTGFLEKTDKKIAKRIIEIINDNKRYEDMSHNAIEYAKQFSITNIVDRWNKILLEINEVDEEFKENIIYKLKTKLKFNFNTFREMLLRIQSKILFEKYKKWKR